MARQQVADTVGPTTDVYTGLNRDKIDRICESLESSYQIGHRRHRSTAYPRYVLLRTQELFNRLVVLYEGLFTTHWSHLKHATESMHAAPSPFTQKVRFTACAYVSSWFWDLQVSIRESVKKLSVTAYNDDKFRQEIYHISDRYDAFLQHLNSIIRPTHIQAALEDAMYVPYITHTLDINAPNGNIFSLDNTFHIDENVTHCVVEIMKQRNTPFRVALLSDHTLGRPGWLFDYSQSRAYSWFPMEPNYSHVDLIAPYILGIPCSPRLGPRDVDEWQLFPNGELPKVLNPSSYRRVRERTSFGSAEYTTLEHEKYAFPMELIGRLCEPIRAYRFRLVDWLYHHEVVLGADEQIRNNALQRFVAAGSYLPSLNL